MLSSETTRFVRDLAANNDREWFKANEDRYKQHYKLAGEAFGETLAVRLGEAAGLTLIPRNFRIFRDVRFSKDKTPYNPHLRIGLSVAGAGDDHPLFMTGLQVEGLTIGTGRFGLSKPALETFRERVAGPEGKDLADILQGFTAEGARISEPDLKRVPAPYDSDHPRADLLKRKGLAVWRDFAGPELAYGEDGPAKVAAELLKLRPVHAWLAALSR